MPRPETGPMVFGDDWAGVFFRGDNAMYFGMTLGMVLDSLPQGAVSPIQMTVLRGLAQTLGSCQEPLSREPQRADIVTEIIAHGADREQALGRMRRALEMKLWWSLKG